MKSYLIGIAISIGVFLLLNLARAVLFPTAHIFWVFAIVVGLLVGVGVLAKRSFDYETDGGLPPIIWVFGFIGAFVMVIGKKPEEMEREMERLVALKNLQNLRAVNPDLFDATLRVREANRQGVYVQDLYDLDEIYGNDSEDQLDSEVPDSIDMRFFRNCPQCNGANVAHTGNGFLWQCSDCEYSYDPTAESLSEE